MFVAVTGPTHRTATHTGDGTSRKISVDRAGKAKTLQKAGGGWVQAKAASSKNVRWLAENLGDRFAAGCELIGDRLATNQVVGEFDI